jgi:hypothetical protein
MACGYLRSQGSTSESPDQQPKPPRSEFAEISRTLLNLPGWFWGLLWGSIVVVTCSLIADHALSDDSIMRTTISTTQVLLGGAGLLVGQLWVLLIVAAARPEHSLRDALNPFTAWKIALEHLPDTGRPMALGIWCLTGLICGIFVVGGLSYWIPKKKIYEGAQSVWNPANKVDLDADVEIVKSQSNPVVSEESKEPEKPKPPDRRPTRECIIIGYQPTASGKLSRLVLALEADKKLQYAGYVERGWTDEEAEDLPRRVAKLVQKKPPLKGLTGDVVWLKPGLRCMVRQSGLSASGMLLDPAFVELVSAKSSPGNSAPVKPPSGKP